MKCQVCPRPAQFVVTAHAVDNHPAEEMNVCATHKHSAQRIALASRGRQTTRKISN